MKNNTGTIEMQDCRNSHMPSLFSSLLKPSKNGIAKPLTLYKTDASPPARTVMMVADILGVQYLSHELNPVFREQDTPELTKKNPMRTIPFIDDNGFCLSDSHAIILYLFEKYAKPEHYYLYPNDIVKRATIHQRLFFDCGVLFQRLRSIMAPTYGGRLKSLTKSMIKNTEESYKMLEEYLSDTIYLTDNVITLADISIMTTISTLHGLCPISQKLFPKLFQWYEKMCIQEFCKRINEPGATAHVQGLKTFMENNSIKSKL